ncbi:MAG: ATP-binding protein [Bacteroidales bacterium]
MRNLLTKSILLLLAISSFYKPCKGEEFDKELEVFLVISSFNPDTERTLGFINELSQKLQESYPAKHVILIEDLAAKSFSGDSHWWKGRVRRLISRYKDRNLKAIIAIGQEAWAALSSQDSIPGKIPIFGSFISSNGIDLPDHKIDETWEPEWINSSRKARRKTYSGGTLVSYSPYKNVDIILSLFPKTRTVAFICDNTYGGQSLKAYMKKVMPMMAQLDYRIFDSRKLYVTQIEDSIRALPQNSAILIGTWKVNKDGQYYTKNSLQNLLSARPDIPVFSLAGTGIGSVAIGGYIPQYNHNANNIANQIVNYKLGAIDSIRFINEGGWYNFDSKQLIKFGISPAELPSHSKLINVPDPRVQKYRSYLLVVSAVVALLTIFIVALFILFYHNKKLKDSLQKSTTELLEAKEMAEESNRLKSAFLANMSHEIRTPLNAIVGFSNLLAEPDFPEEEKKNVTSIIARNSELLLTLITDILDFSRLETGKLNFIYKEVNVNELCNQVIKTSAHMKKNDVKYEVVDGEPGLFIRSDAHRLSQVLLNLVTNSAKYTEEGSIKIEYKITEKRGFKELLFMVTDTGKGIPEEKHSKLFERFGKLDDFKQGAGLGLAISKQIVTKLGGEIWIDPHYKHGARFCFTHPL